MIQHFEDKKSKVPPYADEASGLWGRFTGELGRRLREYCHGPHQDRLRIAWNSPTGRTHYYGGCLLPRVAHGLGLMISYEFRCMHTGERYDWVLGEHGNNRELMPQILIESENDVENVCNEEIPHLCRGVGPVKVLMVCCPWNQRDEEKRLDEWRAVINKNCTPGLQRGVLGLIVAHWFPENSEEGILKFDSYSLDIDRPNTGWTAKRTLFEWDYARPHT